MASKKKPKYRSKADSRSEYVVFGYLRNMDSRFSLSSHIPPLVSHLCLRFYFIFECFDEARTDCFKISDDRLTIANIKQCGYQHTIFLCKWIESTSKSIATWKFERNSTDSVGTIGFGIISTDEEDLLYSDFCSVEPKHKPNYCVYNVGYKFENGKSGQNMTHQVIHKNVATFILNLSKKTFSCLDAKGDIMILFDDIEISNNIKYKFAVQIRYYGDYLKLIDHYVVAN